MCILLYFFINFFILQISLKIDEFLTADSISLEISLNHDDSGGLKPNLTFVLKVSSKSSKKRLLKRKTKNRYDNFPQSFYKKAQNSFLKIAKNKKNYFILDASKNDNSLEKKIFDITSKYLKKK